MRNFHLLLFVLLFVSLLPWAVHAQENDRNLLVEPGRDPDASRVILIIGNTHCYHGLPLKNPVNDAQDIARSLRETGFGVISGLDLAHEEMEAATRQFDEQRSGAGVALFYYAGHGAQVDGQNSLVPVDAYLTTLDESPGCQKPLDLREEDSKLLQSEAREAFTYLNQIRLNPSAFSGEIGADLSAVSSRPQLRWNDTLAKVAEAKARDMAERNYFDHQTPEGKGINIMIHEAGYTLPENWIEDESSNFFESITAGRRSGIAAIRSLIRDEGVPSLGHRKHLLGMTPWHEKHTDIGIGFATHPNSKYESYMSVIIARRQF